MLSSAPLRRGFFLPIDFSIFTMISIDGKEYDPEQFSEETKKQLLHIQFCDQEINRLEFLLATVKTARTGYSKAVAEHLPH